MANGKILIPKLMVVLMLSVYGCGGDSESKGYRLTGHIEGTPQDTKIYLFSMELQSNIDSAMVKNDEFIMKGKIDRPTHCVLIIPDQNKYSDLIIENTEISFESTYSDIYFQKKVTGGPEQNLKNKMWDLNGKYNTEYLKIGDSLSKNLFTDELHKSELVRRYEENVSKSKELMRGFIVKNPNSYFTLELLYRNRKFIPKDTLEKVISKLDPIHQNLPDALALDKYVKGNEIELKEGDMFADFKGISMTGEPINLSSLKGNYIYLSFWSRGCKPCRLENRFFSKNFKTIPKELKIVSFSIDKDKKVWEKASKEDGIKWTNIWAAGNKNDSIAKLYSVQALPKSFLIDQNGIIIDKIEGYNEGFFESILERIASN
ncbi:TlpA disulfide reductase family protein [Flagellimonas algicola]|uniref:AhpC/TSA family protein n=1 Tax=Flagellimonas algicola TaxID=2583815 RepID=A0ABY2WNE2_9FLAO|nr:TlpA disulfide reductase family protein [Allomuricauda algicola]TMU56504.1 AhpC/TSA family protein [Allomuricauda algicola]